MTDLVAEQPEVQRVDEQLAEVAAELNRYLAWVVGQRAAYARRVEAHRRATDAAIAGGKAPPAEAPDPWPAELHTQRVAAFAGRAQMLADARVEAVAGVAERVVAEARSRYEQAMKTARPHLDALATVCRTVASLQGAVYECRMAENALARADPQRGGLQVEPPVKLTVAALAEAMAAGTDVLEPATVVQRRTGFSGPGFHNLPERASEPPIPQSPWPRAVGGR